jgi:pseudouridine-5'-phosphate glycosidase
MHKKLPPFFVLSSEVARARTMEQPIVALESTVITHGLPYPENIQLARDMENEVRSLGAVPATIAVIDGRLCVGLNDTQVERLGNPEYQPVKISSRDLGPAIAKGQTGGTTVAGTMVVASAAGIRVFATGGIGGVHRMAAGQPYAFDVSADLTLLSQIPLVVVCAGAKAILDIPATLETLETLGVPVVGYQSDFFPAFYSRSSGFLASGRADLPEEVARIALAHWDLGLQSAVLVTVPPPEDVALPNEKVSTAVEQALSECYEQGIRGQGVTPFLLKRVSELTHGDSLRTNLALLLNNARVAAAVSRYIKQQAREVRA